MISMPSPTATSLILRQAVYYNHFLTDVATILIVFDTESNANPYRIFPQLAGASNLLQDTMVALGAMHLANLPGTRDKAVHYRAAMEVYGSVMTRLGDVLHGQSCFELEPLATSLLLCMFETMYSTDCTWKVHLAGAGRILEAIYSPALLGMTGRGQHGCSADGSGPDLVRPMRRFLASLLAYLDVAGACATGEGTVIQGDYWETLGGGWEYNLGAPSFHPCRTPADRILAQIRHSWSRLMSVQAAISAFAKMQSSGSLDVSQENMMRDDLAYRISNWHNSTPDIFLYLSKDGGRQSTPMDHSESHEELLAAAACVECYAMACKVYLDRVATQKLSRAAQDPTIAAATSRILTLTSTFSSGLTRLGYLWSVFTAGTATIEEGEKASVREFLTDMKNFGFKASTKIAALAWIAALLITKDFSMSHEPWICWSMPGYSIDSLARLIMMPSKSWLLLYCFLDFAIIVGGMALYLEVRELRKVRIRLYTDFILLKALSNLCAVSLQPLRTSMYPAWEAHLEHM
jgi:hypothetical protein